MKVNYTSHLTGLWGLNWSRGLGHPIRIAVSLYNKSFSHMMDRRCEALRITFFWLAFSFLSLALAPLAFSPLSARAKKEKPLRAGLGRHSGLGKRWEHVQPGPEVPSRLLWQLQQHQEWRLNRRLGKRGGGQHDFQVRCCLSRYKSIGTADLLIKFAIVHWM